ncbi:hypothetical protein B0H67DRAFT_579591 [Lasiosphaeris hirsuta]|uniref:Uncharacterized protein n=1 Tax=Lasiosphaeris hirsuta TaxID=260670 RepID=A0AA40AFL8_9PEZI|nr:hypothetical protein B0H67DRAFT_579591 [Lasiosphaeris hirsuta]
MELFSLCCQFFGLSVLTDSEVYRMRGNGVFGIRGRPDEVATRTAQHFLLSGSRRVWWVCATISFRPAPQQRILSAIPLRIAHVWVRHPATYRRDVGTYSGRSDPSTTITSQSILTSSFKHSTPRTRTTTMSGSPIGRCTLLPAKTPSRPGGLPCRLRKRHEVPTGHSWR